MAWTDIRINAGYFGKHIAVDPKTNRFWIAASKDDEVPYGIYAAYSDDFGLTWTVEAAFSDAFCDYGVPFDIVCDSEGRVYIFGIMALTSWNDGYYNVFCIQKNVFGWQQLEWLTNYNESHYGDVGWTGAMTIDGNDRITIAFTVDSDPQISSEMPTACSMCRSAAGSWDIAPTVIYATQTSFPWIEVHDCTTDKFGKVYVLMAATYPEIDDPSDSVDTVFYCTMETNHWWWSEPVLVSYPDYEDEEKGSFTSVHCDESSIFVDSNEIVHVAWQGSFLSDDPAVLGRYPMPSFWQMRYSRFDGFDWVHTRLTEMIWNSTNNQLPWIAPSISGTKDGHLHILHRENAEPWEGYYSSIYLKHIEFNGLEWGEPETLKSFGAQTSAGAPQLFTRYFPTSSINPLGSGLCTYIRERNYDLSFYSGFPLPSAPTVSGNLASKLVAGGYI
jgi:hypothetical protein